MYYVSYSLQQRRASLPTNRLLWVRAYLSFSRTVKSSSIIIPNSSPTPDLLSTNRSWQPV